MFRERCSSFVAWPALLALAVVLLAQLRPAAGAKIDARAAEVLKSAQEALGGEERIARVHTLTATGTHRRTMGEMQVNGETEISIALPDKYLRSQTDDMFGTSVTMEIGFNGDRPLHRNRSLGGGGGAIVRMRGPGGGEMDPAAMEAMLLRSQRAEYARLLLGLFATAPEFLDARITYAGVAEAPDGRADVIEIAGRDEFRARLFIDQQTHRPLMVSYRGPRPIVRMVRGPAPGAHGSAPAAGEPRPRHGAPGQADETPQPIADMQLFFAEYREVDGLWLPHRLSRSIDGEPGEEIEFERIEVNVDLEPSLFDTK